MSKKIHALFEIGIVKRIGIFKKVLITMLFVAIVPLGTIWYIDYRSSIKQISHNIDQQFGYISDKLVTQLNDWVAMNMKVLRQNAGLSDMKSMAAENQNPILRSILKEYEWSYLVFTIGTDGMNVGRSDSKKPKFYGDRIYVKQVLNGASMGKQVIISRTTGKPAIILSAPIYRAGQEKSKKDLIGVIAIGMSIEEMSDRITNLQIGKTGYAFLLNEKGKVVAHQKEEFAKKSADFSNHPAYQLRPGSGKKRISYVENGKKVVAYIEKTDQDWIMVTQQDYDEAYSDINKKNIEGLVLLGITLIIVTYISSIFSQRLTRPIRNLTNIAEEMSRGKVGMEIEEMERKDEIGALAAAIDRMGASIRLAMERLSIRN